MYFMPSRSAATRAVKLDELLMTRDLAILVDSGGVQVDLSGDADPLARAVLHLLFIFHIFENLNKGRAQPGKG